MSDNAVTINLQASVFHDKEEEWLEFIEKFQTFLVMRGCPEVIKTNFKPKLLAIEDEEFNASTELGKAKKLAKMKNAMVMSFATQCLSGTAMLNAIFNVQAETGWSTGKACQLPESLRSKLLDRLRNAAARPGFLQLIAEGGHLQEEEAGLVFGESLPTGLRLGH